MTDRLTNMSASLTLRNLSKYFGKVRAVNGIDLHVAGGEFVTLLGPSGSGKTTTLRMIAGFIAPTCGHIDLGSADITRVPPYRRDVGMVFQNYALFPHMTAAANIAFPLEMRHFPRHETRRLVEAALALMRLETHGDRYPRQLSGGQQQRVAVARAIVFRPRLLLMDEPLGALDRKLREELQLEIKRLHATLGNTVVYVTHDQDEALALSDRIAIFNEGRIEQVGSPKVIYERPVSAFVGRFMGESNLFLGRLEEDGGMLFVIGSRWRLRVRVEEVARSGLRRGDSVALLVRPEKVQVLSAASECESDFEQLSVRLRQVIYLGSTLKYELEVGDQTVLARLPVGLEPTWAPGKQVVVRWRLEDAVLLPDGDRSGRGGACEAEVLTSRRYR